MKPDCPTTTESEKVSLEAESSPYLPPKRGRRAERLARWCHASAYHVWKRVIRRYRRGRADDRSPLCLLDVGCGPGNFLCCLERWFLDADIRGLDMDISLLEYARARTLRAQFWQGTAQQLPFEAGCFDVVSALQVVEHFPDPDRFLAEAHRTLRVGGLLLFATPNPTGLAARLLGPRWGGIRFDHVSLRTPAQWRRALRKAGFEIRNEGTTLLNGFPVIGRFPLGLPLQMLQAVFGWFPWSWGESYMIIACRGR